MPDGSYKSRIDRILVNKNWLACWPNSLQKGPRHFLSNHCPILLDINVKDWGPNLFRFLNAWLSGFRDFITKKWGIFEIEG
ncbi:hypothetical protein ACS0TY_017519 [Phlomoides rotata]